MTDVHAGPSFHARHHSASSLSMQPSRSSPTLSGSASASSRSIQPIELLPPSSHVDLPSALASLRVHVLSYLSDLEARLAQLDHTSQSGAIPPRSPTLPPLSPPVLKTTSSAPVISRPSLLAEPVPVVTGNPRRAPSEVLGTDDCIPLASLSTPSSPSSPTHAPIIDLQSLSRLDDADLDDLGLNGEDIGEFIAQAFDLLSTIRAEVSSYLPDVVDLKSFEFELPSSETMHAKREAFRHRLSELGTNLQSHVPSRQGISDKFEQMSTDAQNAFRATSARLWSRSRSGSMSDLTMGLSPDSIAMSYVPRLKAHLVSLQAHMQDLPFRVPAFANLHSNTATIASSDPITAVHVPVPKIVMDLLADLLQEDTEEAIQADIQKEKDVVQSTHGEIARALEKSENGRRLIEFDDLPKKWRNNKYVRCGYRFIPFSEWPRLLLSVFQLHNETVNIHTHLLPLLTLIPILATYANIYVLPLLPSFVPPSFLNALSHAPTPLWSIAPLISFKYDIQLLASVRSYIPELLPYDPSIDALPASFFTFSAAACLFSSSLWHVFAGCSDLGIMESAARGDYVGIGWLISASVQSVVYYGFRCQTTEMRLYTVLTMLTGVAGSVVPFMAWFNERRNKKYRIMFFLGLCFASLLPLTHLSIASGPIHTLFFVVPILKSCLLYILGLILYATHWPEALTVWGREHVPVFDVMCSHAGWHVFIVLAIRAHYVGLGELKMTSEVFSCGAL